MSNLKTQSIMKIKEVHIVTVVDVESQGYSPAFVCACSSREEAVKLMKKKYYEQLESRGLPLDTDNDFVHADFPSAPSIPYAYCNGVYIDYYKSKII